MAVEWIKPMPGATFAFEAPLALSTDVVGPFLIGSYWRVGVLNPQDTDEYAIYTDIFTGGARNFSGTFQPYYRSWRKSLQEFGILHGDEVTVRAQFINGSAGQVDSDAITVRWDQLGYAFEGLQTQIADFQAGVPSSGSINPTLASINAATHASFAGLPDIPISQFVVAPPLGFLVRELIEPDLEGSGSLTRPSGPFPVDAFGMTFELVAFPPGYAVNDGNPPNWQHPYLQLSTVHTLNDSAEVMTEQNFWGVERPYWIFQTALPTRVEYRVAPGVVVRAYWLLASI
jgi:hypothetical protein